MAATACGAHVLVGARELGERSGGGAARRLRQSLEGATRMEAVRGPGLGWWELCFRDWRAQDRLQAGVGIRRDGGRRAGLE